MNTDCPFNDHLNNLLPHYRYFGGGGRDRRFPTKDEGVLKKCLDRLGYALKRLAVKAIEALPAIVGSVVRTILSFLGKGIRFVAVHTWALIWSVDSLRNAYVT